jgi:hypothetical protein
MGNDRSWLRALLLLAFALAWVIVLAMAGRPSREPEILDWWSVRAAAVWTAAMCGLILLTARMRWLLGPRGTELLEALFRALRSSAALWAISAGAPLLLGGGALAWLRIMGVCFDTPLLIGLLGAAGLAVIFELLLVSVGRERHSART